MEKDWWKKSVVYQIYPRSFCDSDGDGIGDLNGITGKLDYLKELGADVIWLSPVYESPNDDNGYDISDYQAVMKDFGTMADFDRMLEEIHARGMKLVMDLVVNHTSDEHPWFQESRKGKDNPYRDYYIWKKPKEGKEPNNWGSCFGGPAWEYEESSGEYYLHLFSVKQPDLNWENEAVRREIYDMIRWWMEKGVGGFRLDVIDQIAKEPDIKITGNGPRLHEFIRELSRETFQKGDIVTVGECWGADTERAKLYSAPDGSEFSMVFQFEHIMLDSVPGREKWDLAPLPFVKLKEVLNKWQCELQGSGWNSLFWDNHDLPRIVSRWGNDKEYRVESAKMLATVLHGMQGTPYIYQGEELGMTNTDYEIGEYRDIETLHMYEERLEAGYSEEEIMRSIHAKGRDNARTPMQWSGGEGAGFTTGTPWIRINDNYREINAETEAADPWSVFHYYKRLIQLRKEYPVFVHGSFRLLLEDDPNIFAYVREWEGVRLLVLCNFFGSEIECPLKEMWEGKKRLLCNYQEVENEEILRPYEARMILI